MNTYHAIIKLNNSEGYRTHQALLQGETLGQVMLKFMAEPGKDFLAVTAFKSNHLDVLAKPTEYGVIFPIASIVEVIVTEE